MTSCARSGAGGPGVQCRTKDRMLGRERAVVMGKGSVVSAVVSWSMAAVKPGLLRTTGCCMSMAARYVGIGHR